MKKIEELLIDKYDNHIMPFLWMHGEDEATMREYVKKIFESDIKEICLESRPHEAFLEGKWWADVAIIIDACEKLGMKVWILDDKHFPTGYAAGQVPQSDPRLHKLFVAFYPLDVVGPQKNSGTLLKWTTQKRPNFMNVGTEKRPTATLAERQQNKILSVVAAPKTGYNQIDDQKLIDITDKLEGEMLYWDIPAGEWTIFVCYETEEGGEAATEGYLNPLVAESTDILIETVYQAHYQKFGEKFGKTILGFFSDEPRFGNTKGSDAAIGRKAMPLPWRPEMAHDFAEYLGVTPKEVLLKLPWLTKGTSDQAHQFRFLYMEFITTLFKENFSNRIGDWCRSHHVQYIGHVIEDNNAHSRLGYGAGHFFRSLAGQDMAGIDVVLHQLMPDQKNGYFQSMTANGWDGEFFHFGLAKLGASLGNLDQRKAGRTMCEVFGAYGWAEGTKLMKWLADHLLVRGVNYFVPHAFSMHEFPDQDCPPHFYAQGNNPQFFAFKDLMTYMNRVSHLLSEGQHRADVAVLYHAEAEWSGAYMPLQKVTRILTEHQYEFDILPCEIVAESSAEQAVFTYKQRSYKVLLVPYAEKLPQRTLEKIQQFSEEGVKVIFLEGWPTGFSESPSSQHQLELMLQQTESATLENLAGKLGSLVLDRLATDAFYENLRYYHYQQQEQSIYMLFNESLLSDISIRFEDQKDFVVYNPVENRLESLAKTAGGYELTLLRGETLLLIESQGQLKPLKQRWAEQKSTSSLPLNHQEWQLDVAGVGIGAAAKFPRKMQQLPALGRGDGLEHFAGTLLYETEIEVSAEPDQALLTIENANEIVTVYLNEEKVGTRISYPYQFELTEQLKPGKNQLRIEVVNNLGRYMQDFLSQYVNFEPLGLMGKVAIDFYLK